MDKVKQEKFDLEEAKKTQQLGDRKRIPKGLYKSSQSSK